MVVFFCPVLKKACPISQTGQNKGYKNRFLFDQKVNQSLFIEPTF
jgi:hypothetical protein